MRYNEKIYIAAYSMEKLGFVSLVDDGVAKVDPRLKESSPHTAHSLTKKLSSEVDFLPERNPSQATIVNKNKVHDPISQNYI